MQSVYLMSCHVLGLLTNAMQCSLKPKKALESTHAMQNQTIHPHNTPPQPSSQHDPTIVIAIDPVIDLDAHAHLRHERVIDVEALDVSPVPHHCPL